jgi:hypothetical protein
MSTPLRESRTRRVHLAGERVVLAIAIATPGGVGSLTIRLLAQHRGQADGDENSPPNRHE